jgi:hypothetical protein
MEGKQNQPVIKFYFPIGKLDNLNVRKVIRPYYKAEIFNYELLIIQVRFILHTHLHMIFIILTNIYISITERIKSNSTTNCQIHSKIKTEIGIQNQI